MIAKLFDELDKIKLAIIVFESVFGVVGASLILTENHPYLALASLAIARTSTRLEAFLKAKEEEKKNKDKENNN